MLSSPTLASSQYFSSDMSRFLCAWVDGESGFDRSLVRLQNFDVQSIRQFEPVRPGGQRLGAEGGGAFEDAVIVVHHDAEMGEPCFGTFEAGVGDQLHTAQHPDLPANMRLGRLFSADTKAEHFGEEAHMPVNVFHLDSDVFDIGARETHRFQALPGYSVRANSMPLTQATMVELTGVGMP